MPNCLPGAICIQALLFYRKSPRPTEQLADSQLWHGKNERQGLLVLGFDGWRLEQAGDFKDDPQFFLPARAIGPKETFNLLAVWTKPGAERPLYLSTIRDGFEMYENVRPQKILSSVGATSGLCRSCRSFESYWLRELQRFRAYGAETFIGFPAPWRLGDFALNSSPRPKAVLKPRAVQTLRDFRVFANLAKRLECGAFTAAFPSASGATYL